MLKSLTALPGGNKLSRNVLFNIHADTLKSYENDGWTLMQVTRLD